jgi:hypothetical protein
MDIIGHLLVADAGAGSWCPLHLFQIIAAMLDCAAANIVIAPRAAAASNDDR